jgi:hypothetical protein
MENTEDIRTAEDIMEVIVEDDDIQSIFSVDGAERSRRAEACPTLLRQT